MTSGTHRGMASRYKECWVVGPSVPGEPRPDGPGAPE